MENCWAAGAPPRTPLGAHSAPQRPWLMGRGWLPLHKNPTPAFGPSGLRLRPFGPCWTSVPEWRNQNLVTLDSDVDAMFLVRFGTVTRRTTVQQTVCISDKSRLRLPRLRLVSFSRHDSSYMTYIRANWEYLTTSKPRIKLRDSCRSYGEIDIAANWQNSTRPSFTKNK